MYQDPSGHAGALGKLLGQAVKKATTTVKAASKPKPSPVKPSAPKPAATKAVIAVISAGVSLAAKTVSSSSTANKTYSPLKSMFSSGSSSSSSGGSSSWHAEQEWIYIPDGTLRYDASNVKIPEVTKYTLWELSKDLRELQYKKLMAVENAAKAVARWWNDEDNAPQQIKKKAQEICAPFKNSPIGQFITATGEKIESGKQWVSEKVNSAQKAVSEFYEENKHVILAVGGGVLAGASVAAWYFGGTAALAAVGKAALKILGYGMLGGMGGMIGGGIAGGISSSYNYMKEHGTIDGSTEEVLAGIKSGGGAGFQFGFEAGVSYGIGVGAEKLLKTASSMFIKNPAKYCFVAGTVVLTAIGTSSIEDVRAGDYVYAKDEETGEQKYMPVLETYEREVNETYTVTIEGETIETTATHPFYTTEGEWTRAEDLKAGDRVELSDGNSAEVESVEKNELEEPVTVYNFCVMDYHTYYVGESEIFVHNWCPTFVAEAAIKTSYGKSSGSLDWDAIISKKGETRVRHINRHSTPNISRESHGVFNGNAVEMVNEAWEQRHLVEPISDGMGGKIYNIPFKNAGYESGYVNTGAQMDYITIVTLGDSSELITAFPSFGDYYK